MKTKFLSVSIGVSIMLLSASFFIRSFNTAEAAPKPERFITEGAGKIGKYSICTSVLGQNIIAIITNTETGQSETYTYTNYTTPWKKLSEQLPTATF